MQQTPVSSQEKGAFAWAGLGARHDVARANTDGTARVRSRDAHDASVGRSWLRAGMRFVRNAAIGLALLTLVPVAIVSVTGNALWSDTSESRRRLSDVERLRPLMAPVDAAITPMQAGAAFHALQSHARPDASFPMRAQGVPAARPWHTIELKPAMFAGRSVKQGPSAVAARVFDDVKRGLSSDELAYLRAVAEAPLWRDFDRVASAAQVDFIGGQFVLPFRSDAFAPAMPTPRYADTKDLAYAGVMRAAYYAASGKPDEAEAVLRSVISFGFAMIDDGTSAIDGLIGRVIVDIGADGLRQLYTMSANERGLLTVPPASPKGQPRARMIQRTKLDMEALQARLIADVSNPNTPRTLRFESLEQLAFSSCGSAAGMLLGPSDNVKAAFDDARASLARNESERAYIDLLEDAPNRVTEEFTAKFLPMKLATGAATVGGIVLNNPRMAMCTRLALVFD